jgi:hypothetical protein
MNNTCILVQTCDKYNHLWEGFQLAYHFNWCWDLGLPFYVLTEEQNFSDDIRFNTLSFGMCGERPKNFSTRMIMGLNELKKIGYDNVLYIQDDFWPLFPVNAEIFKSSLSLLNNPKVDCVHINEYLPWYEYTQSDTNISVSGIKVKKFEVPSRFYYNHQSAFWNIDSLLKIQNENEEAYVNECRGTERAWQLKENYYFVNYGWYKAEFINNKGELLPVASSYIRDWKFRLEWEK